MPFNWRYKKGIRFYDTLYWWSVFLCVCARLKTDRCGRGRIETHSLSSCVCDDEVEKISAVAAGLSWISAGFMVCYCVIRWTRKGREARRYISRRARCPCLTFITLGIPVLSVALNALSERERETTTASPEQQPKHFANRLLLFYELGGDYRPRVYTGAQFFSAHSVFSGPFLKLCLKNLTHLLYHLI